MPDYSKGKIYSIRSHACDEVYIGSTIQPLSVRMGGHLRDYKKYKDGKGAYITSFTILDEGSYYIELVEEYPCRNRDELHRREGEVMRNTVNCVNKRIEGRTYKEWCEDNKCKKQEYQKQYREKNKDELRQYYLDNKNKINQKNKVYYNQNKQKIKEHHKQYRENNKQKIQQHASEKIKCECGTYVRRSGLSRHRKREIHQNNLIYIYLNELNQFYHIVSQEMVVNNNAGRMKIYRAEKAKNDPNWKKLENEKRNVRRLRKKIKDIGSSKDAATVAELKAILKALKLEIDKPSDNLPELQIVLKDKSIIETVKSVKSCENLVEIMFKAKQKLLADSGKTVKRDTSKQHVNKIKALHKSMFDNPFKCSNFEWLKDTEAVIKHLKDKYTNNNTISSYLSACASVTQILKGCQNVYQEYSDQSTSVKNKVLEKGKENKATEKEEAGQVKWNDVVNLYKKAETPLDGALLGLYTLLPPRRVEDISLLTLTYKLTGLSDNYNYLYINKKTNKMKLIYNKYKNDKFYKKLEIDVPVKLTEIFTKYIKHDDLKQGMPLFPTTHGLYYKNFSQTLTNMLKKYTGKKTTANHLRHAKISDFLKSNPSEKQKEHLAKLMSNSRNIQSLYNRV